MSTREEIFAIIKTIVDEAVATGLGVKLADPEPDIPNSQYRRVYLHGNVIGIKARATRGFEWRAEANGKYYAKLHTLRKAVQEILDERMKHCRSVETNMCKKATDEFRKLVVAKRHKLPIRCVLNRVEVDLPVLGWISYSHLTEDNQSLLASVEVGGTNKSVYIEHLITLLEKKVLF